MGWWEAALLGLLQGLSEFLPISSSAHLVLGQELLGVRAQRGIYFEVFAHFGTACSIVTIYARRLGGITRQTFVAVRNPLQAYRKQPAARMGLLILLTMVPTGLVYVLLGDRLEQAFNRVELVCALLLVTGLILLLTRWSRATGELTAGKALVVGLAQSAAMLPGISRSGATICTAMYQNVRAEEAADFSFLMAVPVILGAVLVKGMALVNEPLDGMAIPLLVGAVVAYLSGMVAIKVVLRFVRRGRLHYFAYYCFLIGALGLILA